MEEIGQGRWDVSHKGGAIGPVDEATVAAWAREGRLDGHVFVRPHGIAEWTPVANSKFGPLRPDRKAQAWVIGLAFFVFVTLLVGFSLSQRKPAWQPPQATAPTVTPKPEPIAPTKPKPPETVRSVVGGLSPFMGNVHEGSSASEIAGVLANALLRFTPEQVWLELNRIPDNSRAEVMKDPASFRGKKLCSRGTVVQIAVDRSLGKPLWFGGISVGEGVVRFLAVGSSKGIVENTPARFCGFVTGLQSYDNQLGGGTTGVEAVGVFDLPENRGD